MFFGMDRNFVQQVHMDWSYLTQSQISEGITAGLIHSHLFLN